MVEKRLAEIDNDMPEIEINLRHAIDLVAKSWKRVKSTTISNCFAKAGFHNHTDVDNADSDDGCKAWKELVDKHVVPQSISFDDYVHCDDEVATEELLSDKAIVQMVIDNNTARDEPVQQEEEATTEQEPEESNTMNKWQFKQRLAEMRLYLQRQPTDTSAAIAKLVELEEIVDTLVNQKQAKITSYFK